MGGGGGAVDSCVNTEMCLREPGRCGGAWAWFRGICSGVPGILLGGPRDCLTSFPPCTSVFLAPPVPTTSGQQVPRLGQDRPWGGTGPGGPSTAPSPFSLGQQRPADPELLPWFVWRGRCLGAGRPYPTHLGTREMPLAYDPSPLRAPQTPKSLTEHPAHSAAPDKLPITGRGDGSQLCQSLGVGEREGEGEGEDQGCCWDRPEA